MLCDCRSWQQLQFHVSCGTLLCWLHERGFQLKLPWPCPAGQDASLRQKFLAEHFQPDNKLHRRPTDWRISGAHGVARRPPRFEFGISPKVGAWNLEPFTSRLYSVCDQAVVPVSPAAFSIPHFPSPIFRSGSPPFAFRFPLLH